METCACTDSSSLGIIGFIVIIAVCSLVVRFHDRSGCNDDDVDY